MEHYIHHHHHRRKKNFLRFFLILTPLILIGVYFYKTAPEVLGDKKIVATTTPKTVKPKPTVPHIAVSPEKIVQGEPALITIEGVSSTSTIKSFTFDNRPLVTFLHEGKFTALLGIDLNSAPGTFPLLVTFGDGKELKGTITISQRDTVIRPFDIPDKLGGNTQASINALFSTLAAEGKVVNALPVTYRKLWTEKFRFPLDGTPVLQDPYGYTRSIGSVTMPHKGTDFEAPIGTSVYAMNKGEVEFVQDLRNYGKTVIIDHGLGLQTVYMHLSEALVTVGQVVEKGELIAKTGDTGYVLGPHLHLTVRIWDISIDPVKFLELLGE